MRLPDCLDSCASQLQEIDWSGTTLGDFDSWPFTLSFVLGMMFYTTTPKLLLWGPDLITFYNDGFKALLGQLGSRGIGCRFPNFLPREWKNMQDQVNRALNGDSGGESDIVFPSGDGADDRHFHCTLNLRPVPDATGKICAVLAEVRPTTKLLPFGKRIHPEVPSLKHPLEEAPVSIALGVGRDLRFEFANRAFRNLFPDRKLEGRALKDAIPKLGNFKEHDAIQDVYRSGKAWSTRNLRLSCVEPGTREEIVRYIDLFCQPVRNEFNSICGILLVGYDVTDRNQVRIENERLRCETLDVPNPGDLGTMAMTVAHELNQPLTAISNYILAATQATESDRSKTALTLAQAEIERAGDVIKRTRSLVRAGFANRTCVAIEQAYERAIRLLAASSFEFESAIRLQPDARYVMADQVQLEQVFINLFRNAVEASHESCYRKVILSSARLQNRRVRIDIRDYGCGFPSDIVNNIFERVGCSSRSGLGVGLSLTRRIVDANLGKIHVSNAPDGGAIVSIELDAPSDQEDTTIEGGAHQGCYT